MQCPALPSSASQVDHPCSLHILSLSASVLLFVQIHHLPLNRLLCPPAEGAGSFHKGSRVAAPLLHRGESFHTCWPARAQTGVKEPCIWCSPSKWLGNAMSCAHHVSGISHAALPSTAAPAPPHFFLGLLFSSASITSYTPPRENLILPSAHLSQGFLFSPCSCHT